MPVFFNNDAFDANLYAMAYHKAKNAQKQEPKIMTGKLWPKETFNGKLVAQKQKTADELVEQINMLATLVQANKLSLPDAQELAMQMAKAQGYVKVQAVQGPVATEIVYTQAAAAYQKRCERKNERFFFEENEAEKWKPFRRPDDSEIRSLEELFDFCEGRPGSKGMTLQRVLFVGFTAYKVSDGDTFFRFVNDLDAPIGEAPTLTIAALPSAGPAEREFS